MNPLKLLRVISRFIACLWIGIGILTISSIYFSMIGFMINIVFGIIFIIIGFYFHWKQNNLIALLEKKFELIEKVIYSEIIFVIIALIITSIVLVAVIYRSFGEKMAIFG